MFLGFCAMTNTLHYVTSSEYRSEKGHTVKREYGEVNGITLYGEWVYRNTKGVMKDFDQYRQNLEFRNHLVLK